TFGDVNELGSNSNSTRRWFCTDWSSSHETAACQLQIQWFIKTATPIFQQQILSNNSDIRAAKLHIGGNIGATYHHNLDIVDIGLENQFATFTDIFKWFDTRARKQRQNFVKYSPLG